MALFCARCPPLRWPSLLPVLLRAACCVSSARLPHLPSLPAADSCEPLLRRPTLLLAGENRPTPRRAASARDRPAFDARRPGESDLDCCAAAGSLRGLRASARRTGNSAAAAPCRLFPPRLLLRRALVSRSKNKAFALSQWSLLHPPHLIVRGAHGDTWTSSPGPRFLHNGWILLPPLGTCSLGALIVFCPRRFVSISGISGGLLFLWLHSKHI